MSHNINSSHTGVPTGSLDHFRIFAAFLVIAIHVSPLSAINSNADFFLTRILARLAVPFFFLVTGYFVLGKESQTPEALAERTGSLLSSRVRRFLFRTGLLYGVSILLYLPFGIYAEHYKGLTAGGFLRMLFFDGTFYHLWYFPACILGILLTVFLRRFLSGPLLAVSVGLLYLIGLFGDSYYGLAEAFPPLAALYEGLFQISSYTRNGLFFAPLFLILGSWLASGIASYDPEVRGSADLDWTTQETMSLSPVKKRLIKNAPDRRNILPDLFGFVVSFALMTLEAFLLRNFSLPRHDSMYLFLVPSMFFLFRLLLFINRNPSRRLRTVSTWIYLLHPAVLIALRMIAKPLHLTWLLVDNPLVQFLSVAAFTTALSFAITAFFPDKAATRGQDTTWPEFSGSVGRRAWIELDRKALCHNVNYLQGLLPEGCRLMPAVKANAYGHGAILLSRELNRLGIDAFCVACAPEGVRLRKQGITGEILILGYTHPSQFPLLYRYHLTQTVVDASYGKLLNSFGRTLSVHVGVDTGMHRLGESSQNLEQLQSIWQMEYLNVEGVFTHLCTADGQTEKEELYMKHQVSAFRRVISELEQRGCSCPALHLLSSYGLFRYPELSEDYVRPGIALYGLLSNKADTEAWGASLQPVLSLKARIAAVKPLYPGESAGYGIQYTAEEKRTLAILTIGYADGLPRSFSCGKGSVLIHGRKAPIVGRICMDQTIVDVTDIPDVAAGGYAVLIGSWGDCRITACDWAEAAGTITNEILSRLGGRLERMWAES